jgi:uncharacterized protein YmfQ (DUF2313 family)
MARGAAMADITKRMFSYMPPYWQGVSWAEAILDSLGREVQRVEDRANAIRLGVFPQFADDFPFARLLALWETILGLPVAQPGATVVRRRQLVMAQLTGRNASSGLAWLAAMRQALGQTVWTYQEGPGPYQVTIYIPFALGSINSVQVQIIGRKITPAHIDLAVVYSQGFIVGEGIVGEDRL